MLTTIIAILLILLFVFVEGRLRQGDRAKSLETGQADRGSTRLVGGAFGFSLLMLLVAPLLNLFHVASLPDGTLAGWVGVAITLAGVGLRVWSARVLGRFYTRTLVTEGDQRIVRDGPYRLIRHPGYLGSILMFVGAALASVNWVTLAAIPVATIAAYVYRIGSEEAMLAATFGDEFQDYRRHTWRLLPPLY
jgi:protein-S-isoprenylcysteine O-methyltransferase Ste14